MGRAAVTGRGWTKTPGGGTPRRLSRGFYHHRDVAFASRLLAAFSAAGSGPGELAVTLVRVTAQPSLIGYSAHFATCEGGPGFQPLALCTVQGEFHQVRSGAVVPLSLSDSSPSLSDWC